jgi:hypothetical protein
MDNEIEKNEAPASETVMLRAPNIVTPRVGDRITPGFQIYVNYGARGAKWRLQIFTGPNMLHQHIETAPYLNYLVPQNLIAPGTPFYFRVDYYLSPFWSDWAWSGDKVMTPPKPIINPPTQETSDRPVVFGRGYPGATVRLYHAGYGGTVHGSGVVGANGEWRIQVTSPLIGGVFRMTAHQTFNNAVSDWAENVTFLVRS